MQLNSSNETLDPELCPDCCCKRKSYDTWKCEFEITILGSARFDWSNLKLRSYIMSKYKINGCIMCSVFRSTCSVFFVAPHTGRFPGPAITRARKTYSRIAIAIRSAERIPNDNRKRWTPLGKCHWAIPQVRRLRTSYCTWIKNQTTTLCINIYIYIPSKTK